MLRTEHLRAAMIALGIAVLVLLFLPRRVNELPNGKQAVAKIQIKELEEALLLFHSDVGRYPKTSEGLSALCRNPGHLPAWAGPYYSRPQIPIDPWGRPYIYRCPGEHNGYDLISYGRDRVAGGAGEDADIVCQKIK